MNEFRELTAFEQAVTDSILDEYKAIPESDDLPETASPGFRHWAKRLIQKMKNPLWRHVNTAGRRIALIAVILGLLMMTAMAIPITRENIVEFIVGGDHIERFGLAADPTGVDSAPSQIDTVYLPLHHPKGFSMKSQHSTPEQVSAVWSNSQGEIIVFLQSVIPERATAVIFDPNSVGAVEKTTTLLDGDFVEYLWFGDSYTMGWRSDGYQFTLTMPSSVTREELMDMYYSVAPIERPLEAEEQPQNSGLS